MLGHLVKRCAGRTITGIHYVPALDVTNAPIHAVRAVSLDNGLTVELRIEETNHGLMVVPRTVTGHGLEAIAYLSSAQE
jgi:hypothetical protein